MALLINSNAAATAASEHLSNSNALLKSSLNRLSSGNKIVTPSDDAGGLAVSIKFSAAARRMGATASNIGNAVSFLQTQDGALGVMAKVMNRISELKTLSADKTKNASDLANYETEFTQLRSQLTAISHETFNGKSLFGTQTSIVPTVDDATNSVDIEGIDLFGGSQNGASTLITLTETAAPFTPSGPGTLTSTGYLDFAGSSNTFLWAGDSATYDGAGTWTLPAGRDSISGATVQILTQSFMPGGAGNAIFTPTSATTSLGSVSQAGNLNGLALDTITDAIQELATHRAKNGGYQNRLAFAAELLTNNKASMEQAISRIVDIDVAEESTRLSRANVLTQAGTSMMAQANQNNQSALRLIT